MTAAGMKVADPTAARPRDSGIPMDGPTPAAAENQRGEVLGVDSFGPS